MKYTFIYATTPNGGIGKNGRLLHHFSTDMRRFVEHTQLKPIVMGVATYLEIGHPLENRINYVFVHQTDLQRFYREVDTESKDITVVTETTWKSFFPDNYTNEVVIIGGAKLFDFVLKHYRDDVAHIVETVIDSPVEADTFLPESLIEFKKTMWLYRQSSIMDRDRLSPVMQLHELTFNAYRRPDIEPKQYGVWKDLINKLQ